MNKLRKKDVTLVDKIKTAYDSLNIAGVFKLLKSKPRYMIIDALNQIEDVNTIIFTIVVLETNKPYRLIADIDYSVQNEILANASTSQLKIILKNLYPDQILSLLDNHEDYHKEILLCIDSTKRKEVNKISKYDEDQIGRIMNPNVLSLQSSWTIKKGIEHIKNEYEDMEITTMIPIVDRNNKLLGVVQFHDLIFAKKRNDKISTIISQDFYKVKATDEIEEVINLFDKYSLSSLPVVDRSDTLIGFIKNNDISAAMQDEATEDIYKMYGITELKSPYLHSSVWSIVKSRLLWLVILMITSTLTSIVLDQFQNLGEVLTAGLSSMLLVPLLPVLTGTSGNAGSQASASIIRSLSLGEITKSEYWKAIFKEIKVGVTIGLILAVVNFVRLLVYYSIFRDSADALGNYLNNQYDFNYIFGRLAIIAATTSLTLFISIFISKLLGASLPILATKFKLDPTVMSAPILATIIDVITTTTLFGIGIGVVSTII